MEKIALATTGRMTTRLGFGCSSLMGAMGRKDSLATLEAAFHAGIRHFDVAPMYGYGQAESCLGEFLARHPGEVNVTTKYGIPPTSHGGFISFARSLVRPLLKAMPGLKQGLSRVAATASQASERSSFSPSQAKESLERSLRELRTDRIDVWLLHEATAADLQDESLLRLLEDTVAAGTIGAFGVGSERDKIDELLVLRPAYCRIVQHEWSVLDYPVETANVFRIHHRALTDNFRMLHAQLIQDASRLARWSEATQCDLGDSTVLASLMLKASLLQNPEGVVLFSSKSPAHIARNAAVADDDTLTTPARKLYALVQSELSGQIKVQQQVAR